MVSATKSKKTRSNDRHRTNKRAKIDPQINELAQRILGSRVARLQYPGGKSRRSCRVVLRNGKSAIVTKRRTLQRSQLECKALETLTKANLPVPKLLGVDGRLFFQQDAGNMRLTAQLNAAKSSQQRFNLLDNALEGLSRIQQHASASGLDTDVPLLGDDKAWRQDFANRPHAIGQYLSIDAPSIDVDAVVELLAVRQPRFIKWDSRPGNAIVSDTDQVIWIDWEHCGARNRLDDLAWLLADEYVDDDVDIEEQLLKNHLMSFSDDLDAETAREYLMTYGVLHLCVRLGLILDRKADAPWWDEQYCIDGDKIGVTLKMAKRQCQRAGRWSVDSNLLRGLAPWFRQLEQKLDTL